MGLDAIRSPLVHLFATPLAAARGTLSGVVAHPYLAGPYPRAFAHRGWYADELTGMENSLAAFRRAAEMGADGVELDVRRHESGLLAVAHDAVLGTGPLAASVPDLATALDACSGLVVNIEIKNMEIDAARRGVEEKAQQLAAASQYKSEFLANMSHELRTPLNSLLLLSRLLADNPDANLSPRQIEFASTIHNAGSDLLRLIDDILDLSKIEAGRMDLFLETFSIPDLVSDVAAIVQPLMEKNGNTFVADCPSDIGRMHADQTKVRQTLFNLLSNAAKFTDHGTITLRVSRQSSVVGHQEGARRSRGFDLGDGHALREADVGRENAGLARQVVEGAAGAQQRQGFR